MVLMLYWRFGCSRRAGAHEVFEASLTHRCQQMIFDVTCRSHRICINANAAAATAPATQDLLLCLLQVLAARLALAWLQRRLLLVGERPAQQREQHCKGVAQEFNKLMIARVQSAPHTHLTRVLMLCVPWSVHEYAANAAGRPLYSHSVNLQQLQSASFIAFLC